MPLVTDSLPTEAIEVTVQGPVIGTNTAYYKDGLWWQAIKGPDILLVGVVTSWDYI
jgi:hypothetical protein